MDELGRGLSGLLELVFEHLNALLGLLLGLLQAFVELELHAKCGLVLGLL